ncbi:uncharacterized protein LAJ45_04635 [Morchella importuna]|uniref:uncharacterized protein n=1 Tax=Morchella importuna TaxID=1174673 RepID=UPI001E8D039D|nr:uncharacterized protein LAJ45_04635 [Morchella importuna]KAH8151430.1 hypothetical protein LAJ45_04635 [Morchella importuna]
MEIVSSYRAPKNRNIPDVQWSKKKESLINNWSSPNKENSISKFLVTAKNQAGVYRKSNQNFHEMRIFLNGLQV